MPLLIVRAGAELDVMSKAAVETRRERCDNRGEKYLHHRNFRRLLQSNPGNRRKTGPIIKDCRYTFCYRCVLWDHDGPSLRKMSASFIAPCENLCVGALLRSDITP